jgi:methylenetetrahydrofolate dehydrogenase (NADP+) / methenyltetrahydrofolate cyclohydrolase
MTAHIIDGKAIAADLRTRVAAEVARVKREHGLVPGLAVVLVGNDPASEVYVRSKHTQTQAAGMTSFEHKLPADVAQADLLALIGKLNRDPAVHGILVQLPLPKSSSMRSIRPRTSMACIRTMPGGSPAALPRCRPARRSAASS